MRSAHNRGFKTRFPTRPHVSTCFQMFSTCILTRLIMYSRACKFVRDNHHASLSFHTFPRLSARICANPEVSTSFPAFTLVSAARSLSVAPRQVFTNLHALPHAFTGFPKFPRASAQYLHSPQVSAPPHPIPCATRAFNALLRITTRFRVSKQSLHSLRRIPKRSLYHSRPFAFFSLSIQAPTPIHSYRSVSTALHISQQDSTASTRFHEIPQVSTGFLAHL